MRKTIQMEIDCNCMGCALGEIRDDELIELYCTKNGKEVEDEGSCPDWEVREDIALELDFLNYKIISAKNLKQREV